MDPEPKENVSPDAIAACYAEYASLMADQARNQQRIAALLGRYERSDGVDKDAIKNAYRLASKDPAEAKRRSDRRTEYLAILGILSTDGNGQLGLSDDFAPRVAKPSLEMQQQLACVRAHTDGYNSALAGGTSDGCPWPAASEEFISWRDGWGDGREDLIARKPELENVTQAQPRRGPGRPPGSKNRPKGDEEAMSLNGD